MRVRNVLAIVAFGATPALAATLLPLEAEDAVLLPTGQLEFTLGAQYLHGVRPFFSGVDRRQWSAPELSIAAGLGTRAEAQFRWEALDVEDRRPGEAATVHESGTGDARFFTKVRVTSAGDFGMPWVPPTALHFGVKLPNASLSSGLGTDEADFFGLFLVDEDIAGLRLVGNVGMGILGNPGEERGQDDVFLWDVAAVSPPVVSWDAGDLKALVELAGVASSRFDNDRGRVRAGVQARVGSFGFYAGGSAKLVEESEDFGVRFGLVYWLRAFSE